MVIVNGAHLHTAVRMKRMCFLVWKLVDLKEIFVLLTSTKFAQARTQFRTICASRG